MSKKFLLIMVAIIFALTGCSNGVSQEEYDALLAENAQLKQRLAQYEEIGKTTDSLTESIPVPTQNTDIDVPSSESDFIYVNNGKEVQINGYRGNGGQVVIPTEIEGSVVTRIATKAFEEAENITGIVLPEKLQYIGDNAFYGLKNLTGILVIPETVTVIEGHAFQSTRLTGLVIKSSCEININTFANITSLEFIYVEEGCSPSIGISAFSYAEALTVAVFPDSMIEIEDETFKACNNMIIYTTPGAFAEKYGNQNFISVDTASYAEKKDSFTKVYGLPKNSTEPTNANISNSEMQNTTKVTENTNLHSCAACGKNADRTYTNPFSGEKEYYCETHYKEIFDIMSMMEDDVGSSNQSKHTCEQCSREGTHKYNSFTGQTEYYCTQHYEELMDMLEAFGID